MSGPVSRIFTALSMCTSMLPAILRRWRCRRRSCGKGNLPSAAIRNFCLWAAATTRLDELRHAGVDLATPAPVDAALQKFERILDDAERTLARL